MVTKQYLDAVYHSLGRCVEINFFNGDNAVGIFSGMDHDSGRIMVVNFCYANAEVFEEKKVLAMRDIRFFIIHDNSHHKHLQARRNGPPASQTAASQTADGRPTRLHPSLISPATENGDSHKWPTKDKPRGIKNDVFRTDVEISKKTHDSKLGDKKGAAGGHKVFQKFKVDETFEGEVLDGGKLGDFDQFHANRQFGIDSHFNENDYTTHLDVNKLSRAQIERADRLAKEIESSVVTDVAQTRHWQEERNLVRLKDNDDEEALYSAVVREEAEQVKAKPVEVRKVPFKLREVKESKRDGLRAHIDRVFVTVKKEVKELPASPKDGLVNQLNHTGQPKMTPHLANPQAMPGYYPMMYADPMMYGQQMYMGGGYPVQYQQAFNVPTIYYQHGMQGQMYPQPGQYQNQR